MKLPSTWKVWNEHIGLYAHILYIHTIAIVIEKKKCTRFTKFLHPSFHIIRWQTLKWLILACIQTQMRHLFFSAWHGSKTILLMISLSVPLTFVCLSLIFYGFGTYVLPPKKKKALHCELPNSCFSLLKLFCNSPQKNASGLSGTKRWFQCVSVAIAHAQKKKKQKWKSQQALVAFDRIKHQHHATTMDWGRKTATTTKASTHWREWMIVWARSLKRLGDVRRLWCRPPPLCVSFLRSGWWWRSAKWWAGDAPQCELGLRRGWRWQKVLSPDVLLSQQEYVLTEADSPLWTEFTVGEKVVTLFRNHPARLALLWFKPKAWNTGVAFGKLPLLELHRHLAS